MKIPIGRGATGIVDYGGSPKVGTKASRESNLGKEVSIDIRRQKRSSSEGECKLYPNKSGGVKGKGGGKLGAQGR